MTNPDGECQKPALPRTIRKEIATLARKLAREHRGLFASNPAFRKRAGQFLIALLPPKSRRRGETRADGRDPGHSPVESLQTPLPAAFFVNIAGAFLDSVRLNAELAPDGVVTIAGTVIFCASVSVAASKGTSALICVGET
jgi:hypothetical protein